MQEEIRKESEDMASLIEAMLKAEKAEALKIWRMLKKAIEEGKTIERFAEEFDAYLEGKE